MKQRWLVVTRALVIVIADNKTGGLFLDSPTRREAAGGHQGWSATRKTQTATATIASAMIAGPSIPARRVSFFMAAIRIRKSAIHPFGIQSLQDGSGSEIPK